MQYGKYFTCLRDQILIFCLQAEVIMFTYLGLACGQALRWHSRRPFSSLQSICIFVRNSYLFKRRFLGVKCGCMDQKPKWP